MTFFNSSDLRLPEKKFRPELEGLRAVAALLVAVYHIWFGRVSGGVDVFFVVSGFLITTSLLSRLEREGRIPFFEYLLGLARRLFPIAFIVLLVTTVCSYLLMPQVQWRQIMAEVFASAFYYQNWQLATDAVDYLAQHNAASPLQHFWALSIQGQFYLSWPLIIFLAFVLARRVFKTPYRKTLLVIFITIFASSLAYSVYMTDNNQPWAYFDTFARVWEFSLGGILALLIPYVRFNRLASICLGWLGLAMIILTGMLLPVSTVFPGYAALLPICGALLVIIAAEQPGQIGVERFLGAKVPKYLGSISYGFYLWHWPLLIFYYAYFKTVSISIIGGMAILLLTFILSGLTTKWLESPIRKLSVKEEKGRIALASALLILPVLIVNMLWSVSFERAQEAFQQQLELDHYMGAKALYENVEEEVGEAEDRAPEVAAEEVEQPEVTPLFDSSLPTFYGDDCYVGMHDRGVKVCSYGEIDNPRAIIALVGGSRTGHWFPALEELAEELQIRIDVYNKDACRFSTQDFDGLLSDSCIEWNELVVKPLLDDPPDLIFTTANVDRDTTIPPGYLDMFEKFEGITTILAIRDNPSMPEDVPTCVETKGAEGCAVPRENLLAAVPPWENTEKVPSHVYFVDLTDYLCDEEVCHAVIGNIVVYRDRYHFSTAYARTLAEPLKEHLLKALEL